MASNQLRRVNQTGEKEKHETPKMTHFQHVEATAPASGAGDRSKTHHTMGQMGGGFDTSGQSQRQSYTDKAKTGNIMTGAPAQQFSGQARHDHPSLEEIGNYRATAQQNSIEALMAAENRYAKETEEGYGLKDSVTTAAQKTRDATLSAAEKAREVVVPAGKTAAQYAGKAAVATKDTVVQAGWSTAQLTATAAVEGTKLAANAVQGVAGYVVPAVTNVAQKGADIASNTFNSATNAAVSTGETARDYAARKKQEAQRQKEYKASSEGQCFTRNEVEPRIGFEQEGMGRAQQGSGYGGEVGVGQRAKDFVTGKGVVSEDGAKTREERNKMGASQY